MKRILSKEFRSSLEGIFPREVAGRLCGVNCHWFLSASAKVMRSSTGLDLNLLGTRLRSPGRRCRLANPLSSALEPIGLSDLGVVLKKFNSLALRNSMRSF
ncbi:hypothetical protein CDAR_317151 [Caerostris darwini]|uniref:Uncharacterized protein n=1 Tax=Caerostris darwini TaxID=1538125 RepID=A0AAV4UW54_9ARAC|nr:hypothetical protein CDAR_317151 [Caerostris darwini]